MKRNKFSSASVQNFNTLFTSTLKKVILLVTYDGEPVWTNIRNHESWLLIWLKIIHRLQLNYVSPRENKSENRLMDLYIRPF